MTKYFYKGQEIQVIRRLGKVCIISTALFTKSVHEDEILILEEDQLDNLVSLTAKAEQKRLDEELAREASALTVPIGSPYSQNALDEIIEASNPIKDQQGQSGINKPEDGIPQTQKLYINQLATDADLVQLAKQFTGINRLTLIALLNARPFEGYRDIDHIKEQFSINGVKSNVNWKALDKVLVF